MLVNLAFIKSKQEDLDTFSEKSASEKLKYARSAKDQGERPKLVRLGGENKEQTFHEIMIANYPTAKFGTPSPRFELFKGEKGAFGKGSTLGRFSNV